MLCPGIVSLIEYQCWLRTDQSLSYPSCIYLYIIVPLAGTWTEPRMFAYLKDHLVVLRPHVRIFVDYVYHSLLHATH